MRDRDHADELRPVQPQQLAFSWELTLDPPPDLPTLDQEERAAWEYRTMGLSARPHPMRLLRRSLRRRGVRSIAESQGDPGRTRRAGGWLANLGPAPADRQGHGLSRARR